MRGDEMSKPNFFEDIEVGSVEEFGSYEVSAQEIIEFATKYDPQPFHLSEEGGKQTHFGGLVASGLAHWQHCNATDLRQHAGTVCLIGFAGHR